MKRLWWIALSVMLVGCERVVLFRKGQDASMDASDPRTTDVVAEPIDVAQRDARDERADVWVDASLRDAPPFEAPAPRPLAPISVLTVQHNRPLLRWQLPTGVTQARVELSRTRAFAATVATIDVDGESARVSSALAPGVYFWRVRARAGTTVSSRTSPVWEFAVASSARDSDASWGAVPDFDGDGLAELGASVVDERALLLFRGDSTAPFATLTGDVDRYGMSIASVGDINGDGYADLVAAAPDDRAPTFRGDGSIWLVYGGPSGAGAHGDQLFRGPGPGFQFGQSVRGLGDINGDGYGDIAVGLPPRAGIGLVLVYLGSAAGLDMTPAARLSDTQTDSLFGGALAAGDIDGDGRPELIVSAAWDIAGPGSTYLFRSSAPGSMFDQRISLSNAGLTTPAGRFGIAVAVLGDVDRDGLLDFAVGSHHSGNGGRVYVYRGSSTLAGRTTYEPAVILRGDVATIGTIGWSLANPGDVDGDGFDDLATNAVVTDTPERGGLVLYRGSSAGITDTRQHFAISGNGFFGHGMGGLGDVDGDGLGDLIAGTWRSGTGRLYDFRGDRATGVRLARTIEAPASFITAFASSVLSR